ncbi:MAG: anti-sigma factor family protein [Phycisphaerae bacterium]
MNREQIEQWLPAYLDGQLDSDRREAVERALAEQPQLRRELEQCGALRDCLRRELDRGVVPADARERCLLRLAAARLTARQGRIYRIGAAALAMAAGLLLVMQNWSGLTGGPELAQSAGSSPIAQKPSVRATEATLVSADKFADVYRSCTASKHSPIHLDSPCAVKARELMATEVNFPVLLPDLSGEQFQLAGICRCFKVPGVDAVHAHYKRNGDSSTGETLSVFTVNRCMKLDCCKGGCGNRRNYQSGECQDVNMVVWDESGETFAVVGRMPRENLARIADDAKLAMRRSREDVSELASAKP